MASAVGLEEGTVKLEELTPGNVYSARGSKVTVNRTGVPLPPSGRLWGVEVVQINGKVDVVRAQDLEPWTKDHERHWLARRRPA